MRADGTGLVGHAGIRLLAELAERSGLDSGRVLVDLAVTLADGGECIADLDTVRQQPDLFE